MGRRIGGFIMVMQGATTSTQIINLSLDVAGVQEELAFMKALTLAIQIAIVAMAVLQAKAQAAMAWQAGAYLAAIGPIGIAVALVGGIGVTVYNSFTQTETANARGN